jgi:hypothetical protein
VALAAAEGPRRPAPRLKVALALVLLVALLALASLLLWGSAEQGFLGLVRMIPGWPWW